MSLSRWRFPPDFLKISFSVLLIGGVFFIFHRPTTIEATELIFDSVSARSLYKGQAFTGMVLTRYVDGVLLEKKNFVNGRQEGTSTSYHHDGSLNTEWRFVDGKREGEQIAWYAKTDGSGRRFVQNYRRDLLDGESKTWRPSGKLMREELFREGKKISEKVIFESGKIYSNYTQRDDRVYGLVGAPGCAPVKRVGEL